MISHITPHLSENNRDAWILKFLFEQPDSESNRVVSEESLISENSTHYPQSQNERDTKIVRQRET